MIELNSLRTDFDHVIFAEIYHSMFEQTFRRRIRVEQIRTERRTADVGD